VTVDAVEGELHFDVDTGAAEAGDREATADPATR
jgi:hypothetical protein